MQSGASAELASNMSMTLLYFILGCCIEQQAITLIDSEILMQNDSLLNKLYVINTLKLGK